MSNKIILTIIDQSRGAYSIDRQCMTIYLQRQGISELLTFVGDHFAIEILPREPGFQATLFYPKSFGFCRGGQVVKQFSRPTLADVLEDLCQLIADTFALNVKFHTGDVYRYCHGWSRPVIASEAEDYYLTPFLFAKNEAMIIDAVSEKALVVFEDSDFERLSYASRGTPQQPAFLKALYNGFHNHDRKKGVEYCRERLTWLAGENYKQRQGQLEVLKTPSLVAELV